jgi:hypothetical protein
MSTKAHFIIRLFLCLIVTFILQLSQTQGAGNEMAIGAGINAQTGGRNVPAIEISYLRSNDIFTWAATGVRNEYYYQASHLLFYFRNWKAGTMWGGDVNAGFGAGAGYSIRGFQDEGSTTEVTKSDFLLGPALRLNWSLGFFYLNLSTVFGLRDLQTHIVGLTFQNVESLTIGFRF